MPHGRCWTNSASSIHKVQRHTTSDSENKTKSNAVCNMHSLRERHSWKKAWHFEEHSREKKEQTLSFLACMCWMFQPLKSTTIYWRVSYSISIAGHLLLSNILLPSMGRAWDGVQQVTFWKYILIRSGKCVLCTKKKNGLVNIRSYCQTP